MPPLPAHEIDDRLRARPGWERIGDDIVRTFELPTFLQAIAFVNRIAAIAERSDHHPDLDIRYRRVRVGLTTHDEGGISPLDFEVAAAIDQALSES